MKKISVIAFSIIFLAACGGNTNSSTDKKTDTTSTAGTAATATTDDPLAKKGLELAGKSDCFTCHKLNETNIGPAYAAVAAKYHNSPDSYDSLANKIINGGSGNWGATPMTPHKNLTKEDAIAMVHYVMSIK